MNWTVQNNKLQIVYTFTSFEELSAYLSRIAPLIDEWNHHPDFSISHTQLTIELFTYDLGKISPKDYEMADLLSLKF